MFDGWIIYGIQWSLSFIDEGMSSLEKRNNPPEEG
jgi:hypothetical protein